MKLPAADLRVGDVVVEPGWPDEPVTKVVHYEREGIVAVAVAGIVTELDEREPMTITREA